MPRGFIITGTDTNIGKTVVAAGLARLLGASYWKPIQAGLDSPTDSQTVAELGGLSPDMILPERYRLKTPCSPHEAARIDRVKIEPSELGLPECNSVLIVEGAGGLMVPINQTDFMIDLFSEWALPVILVASTKLGTINHSVLSIHALRRRRLQIAGVVFVGDSSQSETAITRFGRVNRIGRVPWLNPLTENMLAAAVEANLRLDLLD